MLIVIAACGAPPDDEPPPMDAFVPQDIVLHCELRDLDSSPNNECFAVWACPNMGVFTLGCGLDGNGEPACACVRGEDDVEKVVSGAPSSCTDAMIVTAFAREQCGWSLP